MSDSKDRITGDTERKRRGSGDSDLQHEYQREPETRQEREEREAAERHERAKAERQKLEEIRRSRRGLEEFYKSEPDKSDCEPEL